MTDVQPTLHFACSRCANRQREDTTCGKCGNDVVQDLRDSDARRMLRANESRWQSKRHRMFVSAGAVAGVVCFFISFAIMAALDTQSRLDAKIHIFAVIVVALGVTMALEVLLGRKRKFPYLAEYDD